MYGSGEALHPLLRRRTLYPGEVQRHKNTSVILAYAELSVNGKTTDYLQKMTNCLKYMDR